MKLTDGFDDEPQGNARRCCSAGSVIHSIIRGLGRLQRMFIHRSAPASPPRRDPQASSVFICYQHLHWTNKTGLNFGLEPYSCPRHRRQAPLTPLGPPSPQPMPEHVSSGHWEFDAVRQQVGCFAQPRVAIVYTHKPICP